ncbi:hypothetical protein NDU88_005147 [Pleurodeles waltl]|uniref:Endonuclease/exonuclease/phosphatase domain-containing protein n=1 Tax=Pleurodeles waltl TaxID=8319 RepID=A0AAV7M9P1_PLEWA|nr:hypothetical protein NDU88_005147 [Pleurodeles waltl]
MQGSVCAVGFTYHAWGVLIWVRKGAGIGLQEVCVDPAGRYVVAKCIRRNCTLLVVADYCPNYDDSNFYYALSSQLQQWADLSQLWGGDLNCVLNTDQDCSSGPPRRPSRDARALTEILNQDGMTEVWAHCCPTTPGYTHYSTVHDVHTRIDYWLCTQQLVPQIQACEVFPRTFSDHSPILLELDLCMPPPPGFLWQFPPNFLLDDSGRN